MNINDISELLKPHGAVLNFLREVQPEESLHSVTRDKVQAEGPWTVNLRPVLGHPWRDEYPWHSMIWAYGHSPEEALTKAIELFKTTPQRAAAVPKLPPPSRPVEGRKITGLTLEDLL